MAGLAIALVSPWAVRFAERMRPRAGAQLVLALRLAPAFLAAIFVAGLCAPSFLWLEPEAGNERVSLVCLAAALAGAVAWLAAAARAVRVLRRSGGHGGGTPVALIGVMHPRVVISQEARRILSRDELQAALEHEEAHRAAHDNFKRLMMISTPWMPGMAALERAWARLTEWAADDDAVAGDTRRAVTLAAALVRVARLNGGPRAFEIAIPFAAEGRDLEMRVDRLLTGAAPMPGRVSLAAVCVAMCAGLCAAAALFPSAVLGPAQELLEALVR